MSPPLGLRVTIISREILTPYSGMLPAYVAGHYGWRDIHIDLGPLSQFAGARLLHDEVVSLDLVNRQVLLATRPPVRFDLLSINSGAVPDVAPLIDGATAGPLPVKPIGQFVPQWQALLERWQPGQSLLLLGLGVGALELAFAIREKLADKLADPSGQRSPAQLTVVGDRLLPGMAKSAQRKMRSLLASADIALVEGERVVAVSANQVRCDSGLKLQAEGVLDVTGVKAAAWVKQSGLLVNDAGFIRVDEHLRSLSHPNVYAVGDVASLEGQPRPKSGVYAVRAGPVLAHNLSQHWSADPPKRFHAQRLALALIGTGGERALAVRGNYSVGGGRGSRWLWRAKQAIDLKFMRRFTELPKMEPAVPRLPVGLQAEGLDPMRCGGCGAKLAAEPLRRVLARLPSQAGPQVKLGIGDDAALLAASPFDQLLTVDGFSQFINDPYRFGRIAAHHCLNDILAMGGVPTTALALATVPPMGEALMEDELWQLLLGAVEVLNDSGALLVGGHSAEGPQLSLGLTINGEMRGEVLTKAGMRPGMQLILTKPVGTGVLLASAMRGLLPSDQLSAVLEVMDQSNAPAVELLRRHQVAALTDVTGFGLLGHLGEMVRASGFGVRLNVAKVPVFQGALAQLEAGVQSSLQTSNETVFWDFAVDLETLDTQARARAAVLVDPQTSGGLLAAVPTDCVAACIADLMAAGYTASTVIGEVRDGVSELVAL